MSHTIAAIEIVEAMFGENFSKELQSIPLSNDTVSRPIYDIAEDVEQQLFAMYIWTHCMIHKEALASKEMSPGLNIVLTTVVTVVNCIKMRPLK
ncbi:SCAN domain-containing protein 3 [Trichonephila clavipes]|uniref:SCAN domain-containing protein 3 n=1 Tax=Trichonephila clavipes TaxID=2585209 RepID=A0A8X6RG92_TRICX|nr:SCAN domain-containing protein 3 [Trichonephila clavipes]